MQCENCGFPFATSSLCPNCNSTKPGGSYGCAILIIIAVVIGLVYFGKDIFGSDRSHSAKYNDEAIITDSTVAETAPANNENTVEENNAVTEQQLDGIEEQEQPSSFDENTEAPEEQPMEDDNQDEIDSTSITI